VVTAYDRTLGLQKKGHGRERTRTTLGEKKRKERKKVGDVELPEMGADGGGAIINQPILILKTYGGIQKKDMGRGRITSRRP